MYSKIVQTNLTQFLPAGTNLSTAFAHASKAFDQLLGRPPPVVPPEPPTWQDQLSAYTTELADFFANRTALENSSLLLALCTFAVIAMSWTSRLGHLGRFSPFTRSGPQGSSQVSDADFSYITTEDLKRHQQSQAQSSGSSMPRSPLSESTSVDLGPERDTDVLVLRNKRQDYPVHFPAYSIAKGELTVGQIREAAAKKTGTADARRIKLLFKGKNLKDDSRRAGSEGLRDGDAVMLTLADYIPGSASGSEDDDDDLDGLGGALGPDGLTAKARRNKKKREKKRDKQRTSGTSTPTERLPAPPSQTSRAPSPRPTASPATPIDKLNELRATLMSFDQDVEAFLRHPPSDPGKRDYEHKRLTETILTQVLLKTDGIETEGDPDARQRRKDLVKETQAVLTSLDNSMK